MLYVPASVALPFVPVVSIADPVGAVYPCDIALPVYVYCFTGFPGIVTVALFTVIATLPVATVLLWFPSATTYACTYSTPAFVRLGFVVLQLPQLLLFVLVL